MDQTTLVRPDLDAGRRLIEWLSREAFPMKYAFWDYVTDAETWRLFVACPLVDDLGQRGAYVELEKRRRAAPGLVPLRDISLVSPKDNRVRLLEEPGLLEGSDQFKSGMQIIDRTVNGYNSLYIYQLPNYKGFTITTETERVASRRATVAWINVDKAHDEIFRVKVIAPHHRFLEDRDLAAQEATSFGWVMARGLIDANAFTPGKTYCKLLKRVDDTMELTAVECPDAAHE